MAVDEAGKAVRRTAPWAKWSYLTRSGPTAELPHRPGDGVPVPAFGVTTRSALFRPSAGDAAYAIQGPQRRI